MKYHAVLVKALVQALKDIFENGYYADKVIERNFRLNKKWGKRDRQFFAETIYEMTRWWRLLAAMDGQSWIPENYYLRWAVYEMWKKQNDLTEFLVKKVPEAKFENINLKLFLQKTLSEDDQLSFSDWFIEKIKTDYPEDFKEILKSLNKPASVILRANYLKNDTPTLKSKLNEEGIETNTVEEEDQALVLTERKNVFSTNSFKEGRFEVQDVASQKVAKLLDPKPGERIGDLCAGAGGKTLHIAALMKNKGSIVAFDVHPRKLEQLKLRARRAGVSNLRMELIESTKNIKKHAEKFDAILIDAPCSGSGVIRRNPDSKWKFKAEDLEEVMKIQSDLLANYSKMIKPGGRMVYATCSLFKEENEKQIEKFLSQHPEFKIISSLHCRPDIADQDGFYAVLLQKS
jgi:16S rRNA (cytosine967-C5)-methyltransferase